MSIRMIVLTDAGHGTKFRVAAHTINHYWREPGVPFTRVNGWLVRETIEEIDAFFDIDRPALPANEDFESDEGVLHT